MIQCLGRYTLVRRSISSFHIMHNYLESDRHSGSEGGAGSVPCGYNQKRKETNEPSNALPGPPSPSGLLPPPRAHRGRLAFVERDVEVQLRHRRGGGKEGSVNMVVDIRFKALALIALIALIPHVCLVGGMGSSKIVRIEFV